MSTMQPERITAAPYAACAVDTLPSLYDGLIKLARWGLGVTAFGVQIMDLPPNYTTDSHDESDTGQQELYVALRGAGAVVVAGTPMPLDPQHLVRVDAGVDRVLTSGAEGLRVLCVGSTPGAPYEAPDWTATA